MESAWNILRPFMALSYPTATPALPDSFPESQYYTIGPLDICIILSCILVMALLRDALRLAVMQPLARWKLSRDIAHRRQLRSKPKPNGSTAAQPPTVGDGTLKLPRKEQKMIEHNVRRFGEQSWSVIYYSAQWAHGLYIHMNLPTEFLDPRHVWINYPHIPLPGPLKFYYLTQNAFYIHQVLILNAEARRSDHMQMMAHHIITIALIAMSYYTHFTRVGCLIMVLMDFADIFLPLAKMLRYISFTKLCDATFTFFLTSWFVTRHVLFNITIYSTYEDAPKYIPFIWSPETGRYWSRNMWIIFTSMLASLELLQIGWFWMICRVAYRVVSGKGAEDNRSDDEDEGSTTSEDSLKEQ